MNNIIETGHHMDELKKNEKEFSEMVSLRSWSHFCVRKIFHHK